MPESMIRWVYDLQPGAKVRHLGKQGVWEYVESYPAEGHMKPHIANKRFLLKQGNKTKSLLGGTLGYLYEKVPDAEVCTSPQTVQPSSGGSEAAEGEGVLRPADGNADRQDKGSD